MSNPNANEPAAKRPTRPMSNLAAGVLGGVVAGIAFFLFSHGAVCMAAGTVLFGLLVVGVVDGIARNVAPKLKRRWDWRHQFVLILLVSAGAVASWFYEKRDSAVFEEALAIPVPAGVSDLQSIYRFVGLGDVQAELRFRVDRQTLDRIISGRSLTPAEWDGWNAYEAGELAWDRLWLMNYGTTGQAPWGIPAAMDQPPELYTWGNPLSDALESVMLIYDPSSGWAYVIYLYG